MGDSVGSSNMTPLKHEHFRIFLGQWCAVAKAMQDKHQAWIKSFEYIDATAGPGLRPGYAGSPVIFLQEAARLQLSVHMTLIENDTNTFCELQDCMGRYSHVDLRWADYRNVLREYEGCPYTFGLLYVDPNGPSEIDTDAIAEFCRRMPRIDVLLYVSATALKRWVDGGKRLLDLVGGIDKARWLMREPVPGDRWYWTFLLGTGARSPLKQYARIKLWNLDDPRLAEALFKCQYTRQEQAAIVHPPLIVTMPST